MRNEKGNLERMAERQEEYLSKFIAGSAYDYWPWDTVVKAKEEDDEQLKQVLPPV